MTPDEFINLIAPAAMASAKLSRVPASFVIAESALESGWGKSQLTVQANNLFGIKADKSWKGDTVSMMTREFIHGSPVMVPASWRKYPSFLESLNDHAKFLLVNPRYRKCFDVCTDCEKFCSAVVAAGYCTDPAYTSKIMGVVRAHNLTQFDK